MVGHIQPEGIKMEPDAMKLYYDLKEKVGILQDRQDRFERRIEESLLDIQATLKSLTPLPAEIRAMVMAMQSGFDKSQKDAIKLHQLECSSGRTPLLPPLGFLTNDWMIRVLFALIGAVLTILGIRVF